MSQDTVEEIIRASDSDLLVVSGSSGEETKSVATSMTAVPRTSREREQSRKRRDDRDDKNRSSASSRSASPQRRARKVPLKNEARDTGYRERDHDSQRQKRQVSRDASFIQSPAKELPKPQNKYGLRKEVFHNPHVLCGSISSTARNKSSQETV